MTREIKFRVWGSYRGEEEEMYYKHPSSVWIFAVGLSGNLMEFEPYDGGIKDLKDMVVMEYTGLKDKNGKEIYEGDIVATFFVGTKEKEGGIYEMGQVKWGTYNIGANGEEYDFRVIGPYVEDGYLYNKMIEGEAEIIGNIYENPELLKSAKSK